MAATPQENVPLAVEANAPKPAETKTSPYTPVADASIANLLLAEEALKQSIDGLEDVLKATLLTRINEDIKLAKNSSIQHLNDADNTVPLDDTKSKGLADRQDKTKKIIEEAIAKLEAGKKEEISKKLAAVHDTRRTLLDESLNQEEQDIINNAYDMFNNMLNRNAGAAVSGRGIGAPALSNLKAELANMSQPTFNFGPENKSTIHFTKNGSHAESSSPEVLGVGMVAAGHKKITFSAKHPESALRAAEAALNAGAQDFKFDDSTMRLLQDPGSPLFASSSAQQKHLNDWYDRLRKRVEANQHAKANTQNRVFSENVPKSLEHSVAFGQHGTPEAHRDFLTSLTPDDQAKLAMKLLDLNKGKDEKTKATYHLDGKVLDPAQYIHQLLSDEYNTDKKTSTPPFVKREDPFIASFAKLEKAKVADIPASIDAVEKFGELKTSPARAEFYKKINALPAIPTPPDQAPDRNDVNVVRAAYLGALLDRTYKKLDAFPQYSSNQFNKEIALLTTEIKNLMNGVPVADQAATIELFKTYYHRAQALVINNNAMPGATRVTKVTDSTHLNPGVYNQQNAEGNQYEGRRLIKNDKGLALYQKLVESSFGGFRNLAEPIAPGAAPQPNQAIPAQRPNLVQAQPRPIPANLPAQVPVFQTAKEYLEFFVNKMKNIGYAKEYMGLLVNKIRGMLPNAPAVVVQQGDAANVPPAVPAQQGDAANVLRVQQGQPPEARSGVDQHVVPHAPDPEEGAENARRGPGNT